MVIQDIFGGIKSTRSKFMEAFWNLHAPGCDEHYLVHIMRKHEDFIPELERSCLIIHLIRQLN
jgi:hypothetical protein